MLQSVGKTEISLKATLTVGTRCKVWWDYAIKDEAM